MPESPHPFQKQLFVFLLFFLLSSLWGQTNEIEDRHLFLCIDSIPYSVYTKAVDQGMFKGFKPASRMISTFPALTNYAWSVILNTGRVEGYQTRYYNPTLNKIEGGFQDLFKSKGFPNKFDYIEENLISQLAAYVFGSSSIKKKMQNLREKILSSNRPRFFLAFIGVSDIIAHIKGEKGLQELLQVVDRELDRIRKEHQKKYGEPLEISMVSDHASTLKSGEVVNIYRFLKEHNFNSRKKIKGPDDVIYHTSGILSVAPFYIQEPRKLELLNALAKQPWVELVVTTKKNSNEYIIQSYMGRMSFKHNPQDQSYKITSLSGEDPIGLIKEGLPLNEWIPQIKIFLTSLRTNFPDSLKRIQMALNSPYVRYPANVLASIKYGYESGSDRIMNILAGLKKNRHGTHGGLALLDSIGFISSTRQIFPEWVSAYDVHREIKDGEFVLKYEDLTFLWVEDGQCRMRLGQSLLEIPDAASVRFQIKTLANQKYTLYNVSKSFAMNIPSKKEREYSLSSDFFDVPLPTSIQPGHIYQIRAHVLDELGNVIAETKTRPFPISHVSGYIRIPLHNFFHPPKVISRKHWARVTQLLPN